MDPITAAILAAIAKLAEPAVRDAYDGLKGLIKRKFGANSPIVRATEDVEKKPESAGRRETLQEEVKAAKVESDPDVVKTANELLAKIKAAPGGQNLINQVVSGHHNFVTGTGDINVSGPIG
jgi:HetE-like protein